MTAAELSPDERWAALAASEHAARTALDALEHGVILVDKEGRLRRANPATERILGYSVDELSDRWSTGSWRACDEHFKPLPDHRRPLFRAAMGEPVDGEIVGWERKNGDRALVRLSVVQDADQDGGMLVTLSDVTEERRVHREVAMFQHLFQHSNDIIMVIDAAGAPLYTSPSAERILGYPAGWRHDHGILGLVHPDDQAGAAEELRRLSVDERGVEPFTVRIRDFDDNWRHMECVGTNLLSQPDVCGVVITARDVTERVLLHERLQHLASHDPLTGLANRSVLEPRLEQALGRTRREHHLVGVCFIDLDGFKVVNDTYGHADGDRVLLEVASRIRSAIRVGDTAVRVGGDEFVVILDPVKSSVHAREVAWRIRDGLTTPPVGVGTVTVGASVGVAVSGPDELPAELLHRADAALYRAKERLGSAVVLDRSFVGGVGAAF